MASDPAFNSFFGAGATQTETQLIILKNDLIPPVELTPSYEFTPVQSNRSEQLALALILRWLRNQDVSTDSQFILAPFTQSLEFRFNKWERQYVSEIEIWQPDNLSTLPNPNLI